jgi:hypothetical protein
MKVQELRVGNFYDNNGEPCIVTPWTIQEVFEAERSWCKPIPLTEEWLLKFEFWTSDWDVHSTLRKQVLDSSLVYDKDNKTFDLGDLLNIKIEYVHQLQNLYFVLTGEELKLK